MTKKKTENIKTNGSVLIAGHSSSPLYYDVSGCWCGSIVDGISFNFNNQGCWVMAYKDLIKIANMAKKHRRAK